METPQSTSTLREATPLEAVLFLESELSTIPPSTEEQSTRSTSPQLLSSSVTQRNRTSFVWKHMPGDANTIYARCQRVYWRCKYCSKMHRGSVVTGYIAPLLKAIYDITYIIHYPTPKSLISNI